MNTSDRIARNAASLWIVVCLLLGVWPFSIGHDIHGWAGAAFALSGGYCIWFSRRAIQQSYSPANRG
jgi:hypothetical protein